MNQKHPNIVSINTPRSSGLRLRSPRLSDGAAIHRLVDECKPLDLNSVYSYLLLCKHHRETCVVAEEQGEIIAFASGYIPPSTPDTLFIWQVAVGARARRRGLGARMVNTLMQRPVCRRVKYLETTITPSNRASWSLFSRLAEQLEADCNDRVLFEGEHFGSADHEPEALLRIGPFNTHAVQRVAQS